MKTAQNIWSTLNPASPKIHIQVLRTRLHTETGRELELKYVPQLFLGWLLGTCRSAIGQFLFKPVPSNRPTSLCES